MKKLGSWLWGLALVAIGVLLGLRALNIVDFEVFFDGWWTLFIIVPSVIGLIADEHKIGSLVGILIGVALLACAQGWMTYGMFWKLLLPVVLVIIGISVIGKSVFGKDEKVAKKIKEVREAQKVEARDGKDNEDKEKDGAKEYTATFGGQKVSFAGKTLTNCRAEAIFGGVELDLREAKLKKDTIITTCCVFGGMDIMVPSDWQVEVSATPIFGGVSDNRKVKLDEKEGKKANKPTLYIEATCVFGGVEIK